MAVTTEVIIHDYHVDHKTGHVTCHLKTCTKDGNAEWEGPVLQYGVSQHMLRDRFNGSIEQFEAWAANEHRAITGPPPGMVDSLIMRKGKVIG